MASFNSFSRTNAALGGRQLAFGPRQRQSHSLSHGRQRKRGGVTCSLQDTAVGLGIFFTPSILATVYAYYKGKGNLSDGFSRLLTEVITTSMVTFTSC